MIARLEATPHAGRWSLRVVRDDAPLGPGELRQLEAAQSRGAGLVRTARAGLRSASDAWQLEWGKAALGDGEVALGLAGQLADACVANPGVPARVRAPRACLSLEATARAMRGRGLRVRAAAPAIRLRFAAACLAAGGAWLASLVRTLGEPRTVPAGPWALAMHGETSTRTRHVFALLREQPAAVLLLGRPRARAATLAAHWRDTVGAPVHVVRPFDLRSALASVPRALALLREGVALAPAQPWQPPFPGQVGMAYRVLLGAASARWWERVRPQVRTVVYGHTGLADTTQLEAAQQAAGVRTVHAVHGVSAGANFEGRSSVALWRCGHDARWHARLGGYGECRSALLARPALRAPARPVVFFTNLLHPMNLGCRAAGALPEVEALRMLAAALSAAGEADAPRYWKPHPAHALLAEPVRAQADAEAARLGFARWPETAGPPAADAIRAVCTPSTIALDLLVAGHLPVVLATQPLDPDAALASWPLLATDVPTLTAAMHRLADPAAATAAWIEAWDRIAPAPPLALADLDPPDGARA